MNSRKVMVVNWTDLGIEIVVVSVSVLPWLSFWVVIVKLEVEAVQLEVLCSNVSAVLTFLRLVFLGTAPTPVPAPAPAPTPRSEDAEERLSCIVRTVMMLLGEKDDAVECT